MAGRDGEGGREGDMQEMGEAGKGEVGERGRMEGVRLREVSNCSYNIGKSLPKFMRTCFRELQLLVK